MKKPANLAEFLMNSPLAGSGIDLTRSKDGPRDLQDLFGPDDPADGESADAPPINPGEHDS
jgi:hypothetical protein